ncbi:hypothetical protein BDP27DRAFT_1452928, partial [Rhodocollybia butyracea]
MQLGVTSLPLTQRNLMKAIHRHSQSNVVREKRLSLPLKHATKSFFHSLSQPQTVFFNNTSKLPFFGRPVGARCCDNCEPDNFLVHTIKVTYPYPTRVPCSTKPSEELSAAVTVALRNWRSNIIETDYPNQYTITGHYILDDNVIFKLA